eukprot:243622_1
MAAPIASPAPIHQSKHKRKRRPTRTPKPSIPSSGVKSRLCSPSPYLDRSFQRKKLLFNQPQYDSSENEDETEESPSFDFTYDIDDLNTSTNTMEIMYPDEYKNDKHISQEIKSMQKTRGSTSELLHDISNLSLSANNSLNNSFLLRNARASIKMNKKYEPDTPKICGNLESKIKKKKSIKTSSKSSDEISDNVNKQKTKQTTVRITKSHRVFKRYHKFGKLLVAPLECGSGCPLYCSSWKNGIPSVTKLMPMFENEEFSKEENVDNALREYELHVETYRKGCKLYGMDKCPVVGIYACVDLKHFDNKKYLAYVMPAMHCNLAQFASKYRKLNINESYQLLKCGLRFLRICHETHIIHNDIKPENIFVDCGFDKYGNVFINKFVFGDFGCAATTLEEFPFGSLTGTITMWDLEALGEKHGDEDGFHEENDLYGFIGCLLDGVYGGTIMEELLEEVNKNWEDTEWDAYTDLIRICRRKMTSVKFMEQELNHIKCNDPILRTVLKELGKPRDERMNLQQIILLVG